MTALSTVNAVLLVLGILVLIPIAVLCLECLAALFTRRPLENGQGMRASRPRVAVLIPAHNEESVIEQTLLTLLPELSAGDRLLVVADNCDDQTAELARRAGAEVVDRNDPQHRGKGYALQHGFRVLQTAPPEVVIVIDADCLVEPQTIETLACLAWRTQRPVQARNLTDRNLAAGSIQAVSILGNRVTNLVRPLGLLRLGAPCRLTGTGMAIPWPLIGDVQLSVGNLVEDLQFGIDLALRGHFALFCPTAGVTSGLPIAAQAFMTQRTRWEQGHLHTALTQVPRLLAAGARRRSWQLLAMAADLSIPPLTLLVILWLAVTVLSGLAWRLGASWLPLVFLAGGGVALAISLAAAWAVFCRRQVPFRTLAGVPVYMARKLPIYVRFLFHREHAWVRTERRPMYTSDDHTESQYHTEAKDGTARRHQTAAVLRSGRPHS